MTHSAYALAIVLAKPRPHAQAPPVVDGPWDRVLLILKIVGVILAILVVMVVCLFAAAIAIYAAPVLLVVGLVGWIMGADWAPTCAIAGACASVVALFAYASNGP